MQREETVQLIQPSHEKKAYQTPTLITHGSVAKLTQHNSCGGYSDVTPTTWEPHHRHRWWDFL